jgi:hypothetical protein
MATIRVSLAADAARLRSVLIPMLNVEAGLGADGVGHGRLKPPSEHLLRPATDDNGRASLTYSPP